MIGTHRAPRRRRAARRSFVLESLETRLALAAPTAGNDTFSTIDGAMLNVAAPGILANDGDADGDPINQIVLVDGVDNGTLNLRQDGSFDYTPAAGFEGTDNFTYKVRSSGTTSLTVDQSQSSVTVNATIRTPAGNDSDSETSSVTGTMAIRLGSPTQPFGTAQITAANLVLADQVRFQFGIGCIPILGCAVNLTAQSAPGAIVLTMPQPGPAATVDASNTFLQVGNTLHIDGTADITCSGALCGSITIPPNPQVFDDDVQTDLNGQLEVNGGILTLGVPISFVGTFDLGGGAFLDLDMQGQIVASGPLSSFEESNTATVTINALPRISARADAYQTTEDRPLSVAVAGAIREDLIVPAGSQWRYLDNGSDQGTAWRDPAFLEAITWKTGYAELGYGDGGEATVVVCDPTPADGCSETPTNANDNFITTYFRHPFHFERVDDIYELSIGLKRDDGAIVYVNGVEVLRDNLPLAAAFNTSAIENAAHDGQTLDLFTVPASMLVAGRNVIAVEVHQAGPGSSDVSFDLELKARRAVRGVLANDTHNVGGALHAGLFTRPQNGEVVLSVDGSFIYTPNFDFAGEDSFSYIAGENSSPVLVPRGANWRYLDNGSDQGTAWTAVGFPDAGWKPGRGEMGYGDGDETTVVVCDANTADGCTETPNANDNFITTYFRHSFIVGDVSQYPTDLMLSVVRDDGVVLYLNGVEIGRDNLPVVTTFSTPATNAIGGDDESTPITFFVNRALLQNGINVLAAEIHQQSSGSSDISFDAALTTHPVSSPALVRVRVVPEDDPAQAADDGPYDAQVGQPLVVPAASGVLTNDTDSESAALSAVVETPPAGGSLTLNADGGFSYTPTVGGTDQFTYRATQRTTLIPLGGYWRYLDDGTDQGVAWRAPAFADGAWALGNAELGYGDNDEQTVVRYGPSASNKFVTTYFRTSFDVADPALLSNLRARMRRDDGAAMYLNGVEVARTANLPADAAFNTLATTSVEDDVLLEADLPVSLLVPGVNVLAVEMHQQAPASSDISFDFELTADLLSAPATVTINSSSTSLPAVQAVMVRGTNWTGEFLIHLDSAGLGTGGYKIPAGAAQAAPLPWSNMNQLVVVFSEPVNGIPTELAIAGENGGPISFGNLITAVGPNGTFLAMWTAAAGAVLPADDFTVSLPDTITSDSGVPLDGDWTNNTGSYPSGDGTAGGDFSFRFVSLPGDVNQDSTVNLADVASDVINGFQRSSSGTFSARHDVNGSAIINAIDAVLIRDRLGNQAPSPAAPASVIGMSLLPPHRPELVTFSRGVATPELRASATRSTAPASPTIPVTQSLVSTPAINSRPLRAVRSALRSAAVDRALDSLL